MSAFAWFSCDLTHQGKSLDAEVQAVVAEQKSLEDKLRVEQRRCMAFLLPAETPRALVHDMKQYVVANSDND